MWVVTEVMGMVVMGMVVDDPKSGRRGTPGDADYGLWTIARKIIGNSGEDWKKADRNFQYIQTREYTHRRYLTIINMLDMVLVIWIFILLIWWRESIRDANNIGIYLAVE
jgi:hypothetical protein